jgi:hypothetical protein
MDFARAFGYKYWRRMMDVIEALEVWKASRRLVKHTVQLLRLRWQQWKRAHAHHRFQFRSMR